MMVSGKDFLKSYFLTSKYSAPAPTAVAQGTVIASLFLSLSSMSLLLTDLKRMLFRRKP